MKTITIILAAISILLLLSTLICGLWLKSKGADASGIAFHIQLAIPTVIVTLATIVVAIVQLVKP